MDLLAVSDAVWNNLITVLGGLFMAYLALRTEMIRSTQCRVQTEVAKAAVKAEERTVQIQEVVAKVDELQQSIPANFKP